MRLIALVFIALSSAFTVASPLSARNEAQIIFDIRSVVADPVFCITTVATHFVPKKVILACDGHKIELKGEAIESISGFKSIQHHTWMGPVFYKLNRLTAKSCFGSNLESCIFSK